MTSQPLFQNLGAPELFLVAAIALLLAGLSRLMPSSPVLSTREARGTAAAASSRAYLDQLVGAVGTRSRDALMVLAIFLSGAAAFAGTAGDVLYGTPARPLTGPRYQTLRALAQYVDTTAQGALEGAADEARHGTRSEASLRFSIRAFAQSATSFRRQVDAYEAAPFDVPSAVDGLAARARELDEKFHAAQARESAWHEWNTIVDSLERMSSLLAGRAVEVPLAYVVAPLSGAALDQFRQLAHDLELTVKRAHASAKREVGRYDRGPQFLGELAYFAAESRVLHQRADGGDVAPQQLGPIVDHLLEEARQADRAMRDAQAFPQVWDDSGRAITILERMATLVRS